MNVMASHLRESAAQAHPVLPDIGRPRMAKADVRNLDIDWMPLIGRAIERAVAKAGFSKKQAAALVGVDDAEFGKWLSGGRRAQLDRLFAVAELQQPLVESLAALVTGAEIVTEIRFSRRTA